jgi:glutathione reductase (NADPH)
VQSIEKLSNGSLKVYLKNNESLEVDSVIMAVGRVANTEGLSLSNTDVKTDIVGNIISDEYENTHAKGVYALGDVSGKITLTPVAVKAGWLLSERLFNGKTDLKMDYTGVPSVIFSHPPMGSCGLSEKKAVETYGKDNLKIYKSSFTSMHYALASEDYIKSQTFFKMICLLPDEKVIGIHCIGRGVDEMMQGFAVAMKAGATKAIFDQTVAIHPTSSEELVLMS